MTGPSQYGGFFFYEISHLFLFFIRLSREEDRSLFLYNFT